MDFALVRLRIEGERIVAADADGLDAELRGLTLLEAAAVGGETLPVDALANALEPIFRAHPSPKRVAVAMSGGVDSAVALLRARRDAIGVTLRLWLDPNGPSAERACCSPEAVLAARATCHRLGLPHVTLDLRDEFRRAVVEPFVRGYARGETPNPCTRCNRGPSPYRLPPLPRPPAAAPRGRGAVGGPRAPSRSPGFAQTPPRTLSWSGRGRRLLGPTSAPEAGCTRLWTGSRRSCATARPRSRHESSARPAAFASTSSSRLSAWRAARLRCSTRATRSSDRDWSRKIRAQ